jgi:hypothetical protein
MVVAFATVMTALALGACEKTRTEKMTRQEPSEVSEPAEHALYSAELQEVMQKMSTDIEKDWPQEVEEEKEEQEKLRREDRFRRAANLAEALRESAKDIPAAMGRENLNAAEKRSFDAMVRQLQFHSAELASAAKAKNRQSMQSIMGRIENTCNQCHSQMEVGLKPVRFD